VTVVGSVLYFFEEPTPVASGFWKSNRSASTWKASAGKAVGTNRVPELTAPPPWPGSWKNWASSKSTPLRVAFTWTALAVPPVTLHPTSTGSRSKATV